MLTKNINFKNFKKFKNNKIVKNLFKKLLKNQPSFLETLKPNYKYSYSKKIVKVDIGDTVFWKSTKAGHNVEFIKGGVPEGVGKFRSKLRICSVIKKKKMI